MMQYIAEAAVRSLIMAGVVRLGIALLRVTDARQQKIIWSTLLLGALAMPALVSWSPLPTPQLFAFPGAQVVIQPLNANGALLRDTGASVRYLYIGVSLVLLLRMCVGACRTWRIRANAQQLSEPWTAGLDVRSAPQLSSPATFGRTILLPSSHISWSETKRTLILRHEESHVRHRDSQIQWLAGLHACLFWFSPLAWWLRGKLARLAEYASDDEVLRLSTPKTDYAAVLLEEAKLRPDGSVLVGIANRFLEQRIDRILATPQSPKQPSRARRALAVCGVIPVIVLACGRGATPNVATSRGDARGPSEFTSSGDLFAPTRERPFILTAPPLEDLKRYYPPEAQHKGINGMVRITVILDDAGRATDTRILSEAPAEMGFGAAASELAHQFKYANPTARPAALTYNIKFELAGNNSSSGRHLNGGGTGG